MTEPMPETMEDEHGRIYCKDHQKETCNICRMSFEMPNRLREEELGLRPKRSDVEKVADDIALMIKSLRNMTAAGPRPDIQVGAGAMGRGLLKDAIGKLKRLKNGGSGGIEEALNNAMEKEFGKERLTLIDMQSIGEETSTWDVAGPDAQCVYLDFITDPALHVCDYCDKSSETKLSRCARCKKICYCSKVCQTTAWNQHKMSCAPAFDAVKFFSGVRAR
mmetsp:Transcript_20396/g.36830  ORF Transcript_20396/g.36830 Transcript_20396/m.36830 type:complete len:220 (+) Transcript_20396:101-760(+)